LVGAPLSRARARSPVARWPGLIISSFSQQRLHAPRGPDETYICRAAWMPVPCVRSCTRSQAVCRVPMVLCMPGVCVLYLYVCICVCVCVAYIYIVLCSVSTWFSVCVRSLFGVACVMSRRAVRCPARRRKGQRRAGGAPKTSFPCTVYVYVAVAIRGYGYTG